MRICFAFLYALCAEQKPPSPFVLKLYGNAALTFYFVKLRVGTPPQIQLVLVDTGSHATALLSHRRRQARQTVKPLFDPGRSSSFEPIKRGEVLQGRPCRNVESRNPTAKCSFYLLYEDGTAYQGFFAHELFRLGGVATRQVFAHVTHERGRVFADARSSAPQLADDMNGTLGLLPRTKGDEEVPSFVEGLYGRGRGLFSICIAPDGGRLAFGRDNRELHARDARRTVLKSRSGTITGYFAVQIARIRVEKREVFAFSARSDRGLNETLFDSGTMGIALPYEVYERLESAFAAFCEKESHCGGHKKLGQLFDFPHGTDLGKAAATFPRLFFTFEGRIEFALLPQNYLVPWGEQNLMSNFRPSNTFLLGSAFMRNHDFTFDSVTREIRIARADCGRKVGKAAKA